MSYYDSEEQSQDDDLRRALEASMRDDEPPASHEDDEEEQLRRVLELSKRDTAPPPRAQDEDADLLLAMEMSRAEAERDSRYRPAPVAPSVPPGPPVVAPPPMGAAPSAPIVIGNSQDEEEYFKKIMEMSAQEAERERLEREKEEADLLAVLERSKMEIDGDDDAPSGSGRVVLSLSEPSAPQPPSPTRPPSPPRGAVSPFSVAPVAPAGGSASEPQIDSSYVLVDLDDDFPDLNEDLPLSQPYVPTHPPQPPTAAPSAPPASFSPMYPPVSAQQHTLSFPPPPPIFQRSSTVKSEKAPATMEVPEDVPPPPAESAYNPQWYWGDERQKREEEDHEMAMKIAMEEEQKRKTEEEEGLRIAMELQRQEDERLKQIAAERERAEAATRHLLAHNDGFAKCPNAECSFIFEKAGASSGSSARAVGEEEWSDEAVAHRAHHRFRCPTCSSVFCGKCGTLPYHGGFTCEAFSKRKLEKTCRFCSDSIATCATLSISDYQLSVIGGPPKFLMDRIAPAKGGEGSAGGAAAAAAPGKFIPALLKKGTGALPAVSQLPVEDVCNKPECVDRCKMSCHKVLPCGHLCRGIAGESACLPCLDPGCASHPPELQTGDDFCNICWTESLENAPCVQMQCKHVFHYECVLKSLQKGWPGFRITFSYLDCPLCKARMDHLAIRPVLKEHLELLKDVSDKAVKRLRIDKPRPAAGGAPAVAKRPVRGKPAAEEPPATPEEEAEAMKKYAYYKCFKCKKPYFGGEVSCGDPRAYEREVNPAELVCGGCSSVNAEKCPTHGTEYIEFKCKFCCEGISTFFCGGTTHFCDACHRHGWSAKVKPCPGAGKGCLFNGAHPPNGQELGLGCVMCRNREMDL